MSLNSLLPCPAEPEIADFRDAALGGSPRAARATSRRHRSVDRPRHHANRRQPVETDLLPTGRSR